jgi:hypothetical protein
MSADLIADETYDKLGGWLILPAIIHPLFGIGQNMLGSYETFALFSDRLPLNSQVFIVSVGLTCVALAIGWIAALYFACAIRPVFPKFYIWITIVSIVGAIGVIIYSHAIYGVQPSSSDYKDVSQTILVAFIWVPYMLVSKRVKATFYGIQFPHKPPRFAFAPLDLKGESRSPQVEVDPDILRYRRKGNRLGIFITLFSLVLLLAGAASASGYDAPAWASLSVTIGAIGTLFGYLFSRLWYWFKAA